jgi:hypothetical protein
MEILQQEITEPFKMIDVSGLKSAGYFVRVTGERTVHLSIFITP